VVVFGGIMLGLGLLLSSFTRQIWELYLTFGLLCGMGVGALYVPLSATATRWFAAKRGLALAIVSAGNGTGILIIAPLARHLISAYGWPTAFSVLGLLAWAIILPAALFIRNSPAELGYPAYGTGRDPEIGDGPGARAVEERGTTPRLFPALWVIALTHFFCCAAHSGPIFHMVSFAMDLGISKMAAASVLGMSGLVSIAGRLGSGMIADRIGAKITLLAMLSLQAVGIVLYLQAGPLWTFMGLSALFGFAYGGIMPVYAMLTRQYFGGRVMGTMYGVVFGISSIGMGLGSYLGGLFFDLTGMYARLYLVSFLLGAAAILLAMGLRPPRLQPAGTLALHPTSGT
jgi:MFS family permease